MIAVALASVPGLLRITSHESWAPLDSPVTISVVGGAVVAVLGWRLGPDAIASRRGWTSAVLKMALYSAVVGGIAIAFGLIAAEGLEEGIDVPHIVVSAMALGALGLVALGPVVVASITLPSALAWVAILRSIGWVASRTRAATSGMDR
jgi:hypothetical protein